MGFESNVPKVKKELDDWEYRVLKAIGIFIDGEAVRRCPVGFYFTLKTYKTGKKTGQNYRSFKGAKVGGNLRSSLRYYVNRTEKFVRNGTPVDYAIYVEKGTGRYAKDGNGRQTPWFYTDDMGVGHWTWGQRPQPFLTLAAEDNVKEIKNLVKRVRFGDGAR